MQNSGKERSNDCRSGMVSLIHCFGIMSTLHNEEENAGSLQFGKEFEGDGAQCLMNDEVLILIENTYGKGGITDE